jgi:serine/threonine protein kinase
MSGNPGTPAYMAPEQIRHKPIDHRVDIFAYGVAAFELAHRTKAVPWRHPEEILRKQFDRSLDFVTPRELNPDIPAALEKAILNASNAIQRTDTPHEHPGPRSPSHPLRLKSRPFSRSLRHDGSGPNWGPPASADRWTP